MDSNEANFSRVEILTLNNFGPILFTFDLFCFRGFLLVFSLVSWSVFLFGFGVVEVDVFLGVDDVEGKSCFLFHNSHHCLI